MFEKVANLISKGLSVNVSEIKMGSHLSDDLGADSLDAVDLIMQIEDEFGITVSDESAQNFNTVSDIVKYLENQNI